MKNLFKNKKLLAMVAIVLALCLSIGTAMIAFNTDIDIKQHVYCTDGVSIDLSQTTYPGDNSDAVKNLMALSEVPKNPVIKNTSETAKKYIKYGASPRAGQALITAAKVRALINGNFNVSYEDIDALAYPVLRHRMKINYTAINEKLGVDDVISMIIKETKKGN